MVLTTYPSRSLTLAALLSGEPVFQYALRGLPMFGDRFAA
jgi:hypothetical protein